MNDVDDFLHRILTQCQLHASSFDLGQIQNIVDQAQQMATVDLDVGERFLQLVRHLAIKPVENHFGEAEDGVHRRAQLVTHVGEKFRFCLARLCQLQVQTTELGRRAALLGIETLKLFAHVVHPLCQRAELVAVGHPDPFAKIARCHLVQEGLRFAHRKDE